MYPTRIRKIALKQNKGEYIKGKLHFQFKSDLMTAHGECVMLRLYRTYHHHVHEGVGVFSVH